MSDHSISIVPKQSVFSNKSEKTKEILQWLISLDIIQPELSDCILSSSEGYAISKGASRVTAEPEFLPFDLVVNGLELVSERQVFDTGENGIESAICPKCNQNIANEDWGFLSEWGDNVSNNLTCPLCEVATEIHEYKFSPEWGFSDMGFTFWNWPAFSNDFIQEFKKKLGCEINIVYGWI